MRYPTTRGPRSRIAPGAVFLSVAAFVACAGSPDRPSDRDAPPRVRRVVAEGIVGFSTTLRLTAASETVERWLLDFDNIAEDRPNVLEAALVEAGSDGWLARFRFRGALGVNPTTLTRTTRRTEGSAVILDFDSVETSFGLSRVFGSYRIEPSGGGECILTHRLFVDSPFVSVEARERDMGADAEAIRRQFESGGGQVEDHPDLVPDRDPGEAAGD